MGQLSIFLPPTVLIDFQKSLICLFYKQGMNFGNLKTQQKRFALPPLSPSFTTLHLVAPPSKFDLLFPRIVGIIRFWHFYLCKNGTTLHAGICSNKKFPSVSATATQQFCSDNIFTSGLVLTERNSEMKHKK